MGALRASSRCYALVRRPAVYGATAEEAGRPGPGVLHLLGDGSREVYGASAVGLPDRIQRSHLPLEGGEELGSAVR